MAFDKTLPTNSTKIRNYPTVLTNNFAAIEEGDTTLQYWKSNFIERNAIPSAPAVDPSRIDDVMQVYSKQNADGETDLYVIDDRSTANIIEITENGKMGGRATSAVFQDISIGTNTFVNTQNSFVFAYGSIPSGGGAIIGGVGLGTATTGTVGSDSDAYTVTFSGRNPSNTNYIVITTGATSRALVQNNNRVIDLIPGSKTTSQFSIRMQRNGSNVNVTTGIIQVMVIGGF